VLTPLSPVPELLPLPVTRPPQETMTRSTNAGGDQRPRLKESDSSTGGLPGRRPRSRAQPGLP
jgi:hypothetical protein